MKNKKFGLLSVLNMLMITALVLAACAQATPAVAPEQATQVPTSAPRTSLPPTVPPASPLPTAHPTSAPTALFMPSLAAVTITSTAPSWTYVAFGDSWPYGAHCNGCRPFPLLYADGLKATTGHNIKFINLTTNGGTSQSLLRDIQNVQRIRDAIMSADIIVIATGGNDLEPAFNAYSAGMCGGADKLDCFRNVAGILSASFDGIVTEIEGLRKGRPTAIRLVTTSNEFLADPGLIEAFGVDFGKTKGVAITRMNRDVQCEIAVKHNAKCIDLGLALNGPDLLRPQDVNTQEAMQAVADAILASGLNELR
jgi:lysophospholipase L1-like esterase